MEVLDIARRPKTKLYLEVPFEVEPYSMFRKAL